MEILTGFIGIAAAVMPIYYTYNLIKGINKLDEFFYFFCNRRRPIAFKLMCLPGQNVGKALTHIYIT